jgi:hypothetical protein
LTRTFVESEEGQCEVGDTNKLPGDFDNESVWRYWLYNTVKRNDERIDTVVARLNGFEVTLHEHGESIEECQQKETANHILTKDTNEKVTYVAELLKPFNKAHDNQIQEIFKTTTSPQGVTTQQVTTTITPATVSHWDWVADNWKKICGAIIGGFAAFEVVRRVVVAIVQAAINYGK